MLEMELNQEIQASILLSLQKFKAIHKMEWRIQNQHHLPLQKILQSQILMLRRILKVKRKKIEELKKNLFLKIS
jgi:hypothetical protein